MSRKVASLILALVALFAILGCYEMRKLNTSYTLRQFMPKEHPLYVADREIQHAFSLSEEQPIIVTLQLDGKASGTWLEPKRIDIIKQAAQMISSIDGVRTVMSIASIETALNTKQGIQIGNLISLVQPDQWKEQILSNPILSPSLISQDGRVVTFLGDIGYLSSEKVHAILTPLRENLSHFPEATVLVSGVVPIQSDMAQLITRELSRFLILAFIACFVTLLLYFRSITSTFICLILVVLSNIGALGLMAAMGFAFTIMTTTLPVLASITALAIASHTLLNVSGRWEATRHLPEPPGKSTVIFEAYRLLLLPNFLMALTTTIGFATLGWSHVPLIREFAWSVSVGIIASWAIVSVALVPLMVLFPIPRARRWTGSNARWALWAIKYRNAFFFSVLALAVVIAVRGVPLNWSVQLYDDLPNIGGIHPAAQLVDDKMGGMDPLELMITVPGESEPWNEPARIQKLDSLLTQWRKLPAVGSAIAIPDFLRNAKSIGKLDSRQSVAEVFFLYGLADGNPLSHFLTSDGSSARVAIRMHDVPADEVEKTTHEIAAAAKAAFPGAEVKAGGMATMAHPLNAELSEELIWGLWGSLLWISLLMIVVFRSLRWALIAAVPNLLAPLLLIATMSVLKTPIKPTVAVIFSIALGVAYNNTVYLLARLKWLGKGKSARHTRMIERAWYQEGNPCLFSSLALIGGFAVFLGSYFSINRVFGAYMLWSIGVGLFGDLIFLPVLLKVLPHKLLGGLGISLPEEALVPPSLTSSKELS